MEASVATRPAAERQPFARLDKHISHSQVSSFDKCQLAWFFKYVRGIVKPPTVQMLVGKCYHAALALNFAQKMITGIDLPEDDVIAHFNDSFSDAVDTGKIDLLPDQDPDAYREPVERLLRHYYQEYVVGKMEPILVEHEFVSSVPGIDRLFVGIVDVQLSDGMMIDFKVTSRKWSDADAARDTQSTAYAMLCGYETDFEYHVGLRANKIPKVQIIRTRRTRDDVDAYIRHLQDVTSQMKELEEGKADPTAYTGFCNEKICQYFWDCQSWKYGG